jgi:GTP-binding protein Era
MDIIDFEVRKGHTGDVAVVGRPNVGKSTFINSVLDYHLTAVSIRPQTTRKHCRAIYTDDKCQIVFIDTPGIHYPNDKLGEIMYKNIIQQLKDADLVLCIADAYRDHGLEDELICDKISELPDSKKVVLMVNKVDTASKEQIKETVEFFTERLGDRIIEVVKVSALQKKGLDVVVDKLAANLPVLPFVFDEDDITDAYEREIAAELIQEAVFEEYRDEVPHAIVVDIDKWEESEKKINILATLYIERQSHRKMILGKDGVKIKSLKSKAISKLRENIEKRINLKLFVKVADDWRNKKSKLKDFGWDTQSI